MHCYASHPRLSYLFFFFLMIRRPPRSTLFPYTRSSDLFAKNSRSPARCGSTAFNRCPMFELIDRKSTRLNSSHSQISYAVFCLKKKKKTSNPSDLLQPRALITRGAHRQHKND